MNITGKRYILLMTLCIIFISVMPVRGQITEAEAREDMAYLWSIADYFVMTEGEKTLAIIEKMKNNPEPYLSIVKQEFDFPTNIETLQNDSLVIDEMKYLGIAIFINNQEAIDLLKQTYYTCKNRENEIETELTNIEESGGWDSNLFKALNELIGIDHELIRAFTNLNNSAILDDCIIRFTEPGINWATQVYFLKYFKQVAKGDTVVINMLSSVYSDKSSDLYQYNVLGNFIELLGGEIPIPFTGLPVKLINSQGHLLQGGSLKYYEGGWKEAQDNGNGTFTVDTDKETINLRMTYAHASQDMNNVVVGPDTAVFQTLAAEVHLKNSQEVLMDEGTVKYYSGGWRDFGATSGGTAIKELLPKSYNFRMTYAFASNDLTQNIGDNSTVVFRTVPVQVELHDSQNQLMDEGTVKYYSGGWRDFGTTSGGTAIKELLPKSYNFRMTYAFASNDLTQNIGDNSTVVFQTVSSQVQLQDSEGTLTDEGTIKYYSGGWRDFGTTSDGIAVKELLPKSYNFRMTYAFASNDKTQDIGDNSTVVFQTAPVQVELRDSQNQLMDEGTVKYYSGGWRDFGTTSGGIAVKELLPKSYNFRMTYAFASNDKTQDIGTDPVVPFSTVLAEVRVTDQQGQPVDNVEVRYYSGGWRNLGTTINGEAEKQLLPLTYNFRITYNNQTQEKSQNLSENAIVEFQVE